VDLLSRRLRVSVRRVSTRRKIALLGVGLLIVGGIAAWALSSTGAERGAIRLRPDAPQDVAFGRELYLQSCASCHGRDLEGQPDWKTPGPNGILPAPPHDETGHTWHHPDDMLFTLVRDGAKAILGEGTSFVSGMPAFAGVLSDADIRTVLSYIKSTWPDDIQARHDEINSSSLPAQW
jgi:S-disulfanyl-L-cysteine oxidoreductase SoxD